MCTIIIKDHLVGKNYDSAVDTGMIFTNKRGLIKSSSVFPPDRPLEWVSAYGSITFSQSGKEFPVGGINEAGLIVEQTTLRSAQYPDYKGMPVASSLQTTQILLDTCGSVEQALEAMARFAIARSSWPVHFALVDSKGDCAVVEFLEGEKTVFRSGTDQAVLLNNEPYSETEPQINCRQQGDMFGILQASECPKTVWSNGYDAGRRKVSVKTPENNREVVIDLNTLDFSPSARNLMLNIKEDTSMLPYTDEANRALIGAFFYDPQIGRVMGLAEAEMEAMIGYMAEQPKNYDRTNAIMVRFLDGEQIGQLPTKDTHRNLILKYLAAKFEIGKEYTEGQVNAVIDEWHTFGDYFVLRRGLIDSGLLMRLPNGSKYWREIT
jgi:hypothetical protein